MPRRADRPPFDPKRPLVTRTEFVSAGRPFGRGQPFDWQRLDVEKHAVRRLYDAGHVVHPDYEPDRVPEPSSPSSPATVPVVEEGDDGPSTDWGLREDDYAHMNQRELQMLARDKGLSSKISRADQLEVLIEAGVPPTPEG